MENSHFKYKNKVAEGPPRAEGKLQSQCVIDLNNFYPEHRGRFFAINNNSHDAFKGAQAKAMGVIKGVSDACWIKDGGKVLWIEFKRSDGSGRQSNAQVQWQSMVESLGHSYIIVDSYELFWKVIGLKQPNT